MEHSTHVIILSLLQRGGHNVESFISPASRSRQLARPVAASWPY